ncbi:MAG: hypothetical protein ABR898_13955 [Terracidiphilus sp.]|jgi:hypothetical protein
MKKRLIVRLAWTAVASPLLLGLAGALNLAHLWWLSAPFIMPGVAVTAIFTPHGAHMPDLGVFFLSEFVCNWMLLFIAVILFERLIEMRREKHET